jgi:hypothetical protein
MATFLLAIAVALFLASVYLSTRAVAYATPRERGGRAFWMGAWAPREVFASEGLAYRTWARVTAVLAILSLCLSMLSRLVG